MSRSIRFKGATAEIVARIGGEQAVNRDYGAIGGPDEDFRSIADEKTYRDYPANPPIPYASR